jgi:hypothetical protein
LELRQKWKPEFEQTLQERTAKKLGLDVIIRDVARLDEYPEVRKKRKGISPWFKVGLMDTYERGFLAGMMWGTLTEDESGEWRFTNHKAGENGDITVLMAGRIPYENVQAVDWTGDDHYIESKIYCHFSHKGRPYEHVGLYVEKEITEGWKYYTEIGDLNSIRKLSRKRGIAYFS